MNKKIIELQKIMAENPDIEVEFFVENSEINSDYYQSLFRITEIKLCIWAVGDDNMIYTDYSDYIDAIADNYDSDAAAAVMNPIEKLEKRIVVWMGE